MTRNTLIQLRGGTAAQWVAANSILAAREMGVETDTNQVKIGDGVTPWVTLPYAPAIPESVVTNLIADLAAKGALVHTHAEADITALVGDLATKETPAGATVKDIAVIGAHKVDPAAHIGTLVAGSVRLTVATTAPSSPAVSDLWVDST